MASGFMQAVVLFNLPAGVSTLDSGVRYSTQPVEIPTNALVWENGKIYEYVRLSATCTRGDLLYLTGSTGGDVVKLQTAVKPYGVSLVSPTASGDFSFILKRGIHASAQITNTVGGVGLSASLFGGGGSAAFNLSGYLTALADNVTSPTAHSGLLFHIGTALTASTGSNVAAFINLF